MAGIYIHIPFCKQACNYCNFHFSTSLQHQQQLTDALISEISIRSTYLPDRHLESIYFGGGTPSLLTPLQLDALFNSIYKHFIVAPGAEITFEANPDDLTAEKIAALKHTPVNRFSIGVQSFFEEELRWMNRAHNAEQAIHSIKRVQDKGFDAITIDLIYGSPTLTNAKWEANLQQAIGLGLKHISSYCLTVEPQTKLDHLIRQHKLPPLNEEQAAEQFDILVNTLEANGFEQYEISNFAREGKYAVHNTNYWKNKPYLGIGPSAHSFNNHSRSWNIANNMRYIKGIESGIPDMETEELTLENRVNEYIMTGLRTIWGIHGKYIRETFGDHVYKQLLPSLQALIQDGAIERQGDHFRLTRKAKILADGIASDLFLDDTDA
jgi:oxygen-independent coproporphyrinogen-3 oxidase